VALVAAALIAAALGGVLLAGDGHGLDRRHVTVAGVPLDEVHPDGGGRRPGVVVAHGFSGSAELMAPFGDSLAARGYVVVLLDFAGHGADTVPLPDDAAATGASVAALQHDLDVAVAHLRGLPDVDPSRVGLVGHSMGATEVTRYAAAHPTIAATVALSLPDSSVAQSARPADLLMLYGSLEFPGFPAAAADALAHGGPDRRAEAVPGVEHISILYAPRAHRETVSWLDGRLGGPFTGRALPWPLRRIGGAVLLTVAFLAAFHPLAGVLLRGPLWITGSDRRAPVVESAPPRRGGGRWWGRLARLCTSGSLGKLGKPSKPGGWGQDSRRLRGPATAVGVATGATVVAVLVAPHLPTIALPMAIAGFLLGYTVVIGSVLTAYAIARKPKLAPRPSGRGGRGVPLIGYAVAAIAVPVNLGLTHAVPVGPRWWVLPLLWAGFGLLAYGAERATGGNAFGVPAISAVVVAGLVGAAATGRTHGFVLLAVPPLVLLFGWQAVWSLTLNRLRAPAWLIAATGSVVVAWPLATALPLVG
jgi:dienelactone hydrolase